MWYIVIIFIIITFRKYSSDTDIHLSKYLLIVIALGHSSPTLFIVLWLSHF